MEIGKIEQGIPIPSKYPFADLEVDDSFLIKFSDDETVRVRRTLHTAKRRAEIKLNRKFITRTVKEENGIRVWRIS